MAADWAASLGTSLVGLAGIAATYFTARTQRRTHLDSLDHQRRYQFQDALRNEKKATYVEFVSLGHLQYQRIKARNQQLDGAEALMQQTHLDVQRAWLHARLVAPSSLWPDLDELYQILDRLEQSTTEAQWVELAQRGRELREQVLRKMNTELGQLPAPSDPSRSRSS